MVLQIIDFKLAKHLQIDSLVHSDLSRLANILVKFLEMKRNYVAVTSLKLAKRLEIDSLKEADHSRLSPLSWQKILQVELTSEGKGIMLCTMLRTVSFKVTTCKCFAYLEDRQCAPNWL